ncbi:hypothetical protein LOZ66_003103 [Ophidiomyces ophidiicola]|nr:hypothetical protein LOZ66_003103 [Ophidiomyces ophidiicola]
MKYHTSLLALCAASASASYTANLNYRSPSLNHPDLGIALNKVIKRSNSNALFDPSKLSFTHGVASGDPWANSVILWTRCAPTTESSTDTSAVTGFSPLFGRPKAHKSSEKQQPGSKAPVCIQWKIATDKALTQVADEGIAYTGSDIDYTLKVEASNLHPFTTYYYQFSICNSDKKSPLGRTKTLPDPSQKVDGVKLAVYSCANYPAGFFNAYGNTVRKDSVDYVLHLGRLLESGSGKAIGRVPQPNRIIYTLNHYRTRHGSYRTDLDLLASHQNFAWIPVWDDHEVADNAYRDGSSALGNHELSFLASGGVSVDQRKMNAVRAYFEWMPIRQVDMDDNLRIWRNFQVGQLIDIMMLDTRNYDRSITELYLNHFYVQKLKDDASRTLMGSRQENWFYRNLKKSADRGATWRIVGSQLGTNIFSLLRLHKLTKTLVFSHMNLRSAFGLFSSFNLDAWDGYRANRNRTFETIYNNKIKNTIMIAGDSHANWVSDLHWQDHGNYDPKTGAGAVGVEFAGSAVTSRSAGGANIKIDGSIKKSKSAVNDNDVLQWSEMYYRGYFELHVTPQEVQAKFFGIPDIRKRNPLEVTLANFTVKEGANCLDRGTAGLPAGGVVGNGWLKGGKVVKPEVANNTETGKWEKL